MNLPKGIIAGLDEAGRGSWAGPVVAAAVIIPKGLRLPGLADSKKLTPEKREQLYSQITSKCHFGLGIIPHDFIDSHGLLHATFKAFEIAVNELKLKPDHLLIDGRDRFKFVVPHTSIIKGDQKIKAISAASIVAKVARDKLMLKYDQSYPGYGFAEHKGYGTSQHLNAIVNMGVLPIHRQSYEPLMKIKWSQQTFL
ncbi:ribonuclease HII [Patescibacteria group bacterium]|nr:ribonuclease HII [Patescibacteria group bacterium]